MGACANNILAEANSTKEAAYFTPDKDLNSELRQGLVDPSEVFGVFTSEEGLTISTPLQTGWTWFAAKDLHHGEQTISFFFFDGWLYTNESVLTPYRRKKCQRDVSDLIRSNVFVIAFYSEKVIEKEFVLFIASDEEVEAELTIDKELWGEEKRITYPLKAGEGHFISVMKMSEEFRPWFLPAKKVDRHSISLNQDWKFIKQDVSNAFRRTYNDDEWETVSIPHCWNRSDVYDMRNVYDGYDVYHAYYRGIGWYRKEFFLDASLKGKKIFLQFEAANQIAEVWVNGDYLGKHVGGYTGFSFDITDFVNFGRRKNLLAVRVDNSYNYDIPPHTADFVIYGGIYRDVRILANRQLFIQEPFISFPEVSDSSAKARIQTTVINDTKNTVEVTLLTNVVSRESEIEASIQSTQVIDLGSRHQFDQITPEIDSPNLWSPDNPNLYSIYSTIYVDGRPVDEVETPIGIRWYAFDADEGFFLNGKPLKLRGVNKHQDRLGFGNAVPDSLLVKDIEIIKNMGANFIRLAHYPHDPSVLDACDRLGLLMWEEIPLVNSVGGERFNKNTQQMMREMIRRDRNHPSVILWGITNESAMGFANKEQVPKIIGLLKDLHSMAHQEDPSRLTVQAHNHFKDIAIADITDVIGRNRYFGWYEGGFSDFEKALDEEHQAHPGWKTIVSEYGTGSKRGHHVDNPIAFDFSEEYQLNFHEHYLKAINKRSWLAGGAVWNAFDFGSFVKRGNVPRINQKGLCDMSRRPKDVYYFYQSQWSNEPMVYIVSHTRKSYQGPLGGSRKIRVYSNGDTVELFLNGNSLGKMEKQFVFVWDVSLIPGENFLRAVAHKGDNVVEDQIVVAYLVEEDKSHENK